MAWYNHPVKPCRKPLINLLFHIVIRLYINIYRSLQSNFDAPWLMREVGTKVLGSMSRKPDTSGTVGFAPTFDDTPSIAYIRLIPIQPNSHHLGPCKRSLPSLPSSSLPLSLFLSLSLSLSPSLSLSLSVYLSTSVAKRLKLSDFGLAVFLLRPRLRLKAYDSKGSGFKVLAESQQASCQRVLLLQFRRKKLALDLGGALWPQMPHLCTFCGQGV